MLAVVSHDAGGAEILSSYVRQRGLNCIYVLEGPALNIFERKLGSIAVLPLKEAVMLSTSILCGTSWQSDLEFNAIKMARLLGKGSIVFLDHWVNYYERFVRSGELCLPDEIWVGDSVAECIAKEIFPAPKIRLVENPYTQDIRNELVEIPTRPSPNPDKLSVLYVCEPIREHALRNFGDECHWGYVEEDALRYFLTNISALGKPMEYILIRPHPSEPVDKYLWAQREFDMPIIQGGTHSLLEEVVDCDIVVGCQSMAMVVGLLASKRVISCIPPQGKPCALPHREIVRFQELIISNRETPF
jgi:hypothetical protein